MNLSRQPSVLESRITTMTCLRPELTKSSAASCRSKGQNAGFVEMQQERRCGVCSAAREERSTLGGIAQQIKDGEPSEKRRRSERNDGSSCEMDFVG